MMCSIDKIHSDGDNLENCAYRSSWMREERYIWFAHKRAHVSDMLWIANTMKKQWQKKGISIINSIVCDVWCGAFSLSLCSLTLINFVLLVFIYMGKEARAVERLYENWNWIFVLYVYTAAAIFFFLFIFFVFFFVFFLRFSSCFANISPPNAFSWKYT